jgi:lipopolysaccharide transport system permease protein
MKASPPTRELGSRVWGSSASVDVSSSPLRRSARQNAHQFREIVLHLAGRQLASAHRYTFVGWAWPLIRQLAQLAVLVFVFSKIVDLGIDNYAAFIFSGLIAWTWFGTGLSTAASCLIKERYLVFQPKFPLVTLPVVSATVPLLDVLVALPVLATMLILGGDLSWTIVLLPLLLGIQLLLMCGIAWCVAAASVYLRDVPNIVEVALTLLFYLTPVFYDLSNIPARYRWLLELNPLTTLLEGYRALLMGRPFPDALSLALVTAASAIVALLGLWFFRRVQHGFVDEL